MEDQILPFFDGNIQSELTELNEDQGGRRRERARRDSTIKIDFLKKLLD